MERNSPRRRSHRGPMRKRAGSVANQENRAAFAATAGSSHPPDSSGSGQAVCLRLFKGPTSLSAAPIWTLFFWSWHRSRNAGFSVSPSFLPALFPPSLSHSRSSPPLSLSGLTAASAIFCRESLLQPSVSISYAHRS